MAARLWGEVGHEVRQLAHMVLPLWGQNLSQVLLGLIAIAFVGHLGDPLALSQVVLASSIFNVTGASIMTGLSSGMETFCGQGAGAGNHALLGTVLQRAVLICLITCLPITALWAFAEPVIIWLGQPPAIAEGAARFLWRAAPAVYLLALSECLKRYLLAQRVVLPGAAITAFTTLCAPLFYWVTIYKLRLGVDGAAAGFVMCTLTSTALLAAYTALRDARRRGRRDATWRGLSLDALREWGGYLRLAVPSTVALCSEWWTYEVVIFMAGLLPDAEVAVGVMGIAFQLSAVAYMATIALAASANTRVANALGAGAPRAAAVSCWVAFALVCASQAAQSAAVGFGSRRLVQVFSSSEDVAAAAVPVMPLLAGTLVGDGANGVLQGVLRGAGRQLLSAALNLLGYWAFGVPLSMYLGFHEKLGVRGFWAALLATTSGMALVQAGVISRLDWKAECARAAALVGACDGGEPREAPRAGAAEGADVEAGPGAGAGGKAAAVGLPEEERPLLLDSSRSFNASRLLSVSNSVSNLDRGDLGGDSRVSIDMVSAASFRASGAGAAAPGGEGGGGGGGEAAPGGPARVRWSDGGGGGEERGGGGGGMGGAEPGDWPDAGPRACDGRGDAGGDGAAPRAAPPLGGRPGGGDGAPARDTRPAAARGAAGKGAG